MSVPDDDEDGLEECMLVMKPCDPALTTDEDQCLDEEVRDDASAILNRVMRLTRVLRSVSVNSGAKLGECVSLCKWCG